MRHEKTALRIRSILTEKNMKAQELADKAGVNKASISHYVNGLHEPSVVNSGKMARVLGCNHLWLMGFDVEKEVDEEQAEQAPEAKCILACMKSLNRNGMKKLLERAEELTEMAKYKKDS